MSKIYILSLLFCICLWSCESETTYRFPYAVNAPQSVRELPPMLKEVSGLSLYKNEQLACVQDEAGIIYMYDWQAEKITKKVDFQVFDDFEGVEIVDGNGFALTSEGTLYEITRLTTATIREQIDIGKFADFEGLGYQSSNNRLLIVPKEKLEKGKLFIFSYDLETRELKTPFLITNETLKRFCKKNNIKCDIPKKKFPFEPSGIAEHPISKNIYIIASNGKTLCVLSPTGKLLHLQNLDETIYPQPEGITFFENGDLVIASEGEEFGRLVRIKMQ